MTRLIIALLACSGPTLADVSHTLPPPYTPPSETRVIRIWGHPELRELVERWRDAYRVGHPNLRFEINMSGSDIAMAGLYTGRADLALLGRDATPSEVQAFEWVYQYKPSRTTILNGSVDAPGRAAALSVLVNESNPIESLDLSQLDAAIRFNDQTSEQVDRWGELGLDGTWSDAPVRVYLFDTESGTGRFFRRIALGGTRHLDWRRVTEFGMDAEHGNASSQANRLMLEALASDPYGLAVAITDKRIKGVKIVPVKSCDQCAGIVASRATVANHTYPLARQLFAYFNRPDDNDLDPVVADFLAFVTGPGQALIETYDRYVPLTLFGAHAAGIAAIGGGLARD